MRASIPSEKPLYIKHIARFCLHIPQKRCCNSGEKLAEKEQQVEYNFIKLIERRRKWQMLEGVMNYFKGKRVKDFFRGNRSMWMVVLLLVTISGGGIFRHQWYI